MSVPDYLRVWRQQAIRQGWTVTLTSKCHWKWTPPPGVGHVTFTAGTPRHGYHARTNLRSQLRRAGLDI